MKGIKDIDTTELGFIINDLMMDYFADIVDYQFTADMEERLDSVEEGKSLEGCYKDFILPLKPYWIMQMVTFPR